MTIILNHPPKFFTDDKLYTTISCWLFTCLNMLIGTKSESQNFALNFHKMYLGNQAPVAWGKCWTQFGTLWDLVFSGYSNRVFKAHMQSATTTKIYQHHLVVIRHGSVISTQVQLFRYFTLRSLQISIKELSSFSLDED